MTKKTDQDALLIRYLLGTATEDEQARLEEQFFTDDDQYQLLQAIEDELRYEYAEGGLSAAERKSFESRFLKTPEDRQKVELAKAVLAKAYEAQAEATVLAPKESKNWLASIFGFLALQRLSFASAALLVVLSAGSWFVLRTVQLRDEVERLQAQQKRIEQETQQKLAAGKREQDELAKELEKARAAKQAEKPAPGVFGFVLMPGLVRGAEGPKRLVIPTGAVDVTMQLDVKGKGPFTGYRAELQNLDGDVLWSQKVAQPAVTIPARLFAPGDYVVILKGISASGEAVDAGEFYFQSVRK